MIEYILHGLLAVPLTFLGLKSLSYLSNEEISLRTAVTCAALAACTGTLGLMLSILLNPCTIGAAIKYLYLKLPSSLDKPL